MNVTVAAEQTIKEIVLPFYISSSLPVMCRKGMVKKVESLYRTYRQLTIARKAKPDRRSPDFENRCQQFEAGLNEAFFVPPNGRLDELSPEDAELHLKIKAT